MSTFNVAPPPYLGDDETDPTIGPLSPWLNRPPQVRPQGPLTVADFDPSNAGPSTGPLSLADLADQSPTAIPLGASQGASAASPAPTAPVEPPGMIDGPPPGPGRGYQDDLSRLKEVYGQRPQLPQPKWWQNALGAAAGFGAGWSNAASRTRNPIDIGQLRQNILAPGYSQKLAEWQSRVTPLEQQAQVEGAKQEAWWKNQQLQAQTEMMRKHGDYWESRTQLERNQWKIDEKTGILYNTITGERSTPPPTADDRYRTAKALGSPDDEARYYAYNGNLAGYGSTLSPADKPTILPPGAILIGPDHKEIASNPKPDKDTSIADELKLARLEEQQNRASDRIESTKAAQEQTILQDRHADVAKLLTAAGVSTEGELWADPTNAEKLKAINRRYAPRLQTMQNQYAASIRNRGGAAPGYDVNPDTLQAVPRGGGTTQPPTTAPAAPAPRAAPASQAAPGKSAAPSYTEAQVRAAAVAKHKDPDAAVRIARERKLIP